MARLLELSWVVSRIVAHGIGVAVDVDIDVDIVMVGTMIGYCVGCDR